VVVLLLMLVGMIDPLAMLCGVVCGYAFPLRLRGVVIAVVVDATVVLLINEATRIGDPDWMLYLVQIPPAALLHVGLVFALRSTRVSSTATDPADPQSVAPEQPSPR